MKLPFGRRDPQPAPRLPHARPMVAPSSTVDATADAGADEDATETEARIPFACSTCGRTDLPEAGDWDPPICEECDAALNFDALREEVGDEA